MRLTNFINGLSFGLTAPNPRGTRNHPHEALLTACLALVDSGLQLNLEIALSGASAKVKPPSRFFRTSRKCVETSDDVIEDDLTSTPDSRIWDFSPIRLEAAKTARESAKSPDDPATLIRRGACLLQWKWTRIAAV